MSKYSEDVFKGKRANTRNSRLGDVRMTKSKLVPPRIMKIEIVKEINESALYLFEFYVSKITNNVIDLNDDKMVARTIGWTARKVREYRLKLTAAEYILFKTRKLDGVTYNMWVITKEEVREFKNSAKDITKVIVTLDEVIDGKSNRIEVKAEVDSVETELTVSNLCGCDTNRAHDSHANVCRDCDKPIKG